MGEAPDFYLEERKTVKKFVFSLALAAILASTGAILPQATADDLLTIGSDAPALDVEHWVQDGGGKFKPVTKFESGKVYVVEFWATWCGPCIMSMPHLASVQEEYASKGVQLVSISDEDLETVEKFLEREVRGQEPAEGEKKQTYKDLTSAYCLTTDPDQSSYKDYMQAAAQNGIPTCFIVGKSAKVEWIGHPMEMDGPLAAVVEDSWDRDAFAKEMKAKQEAEKAMSEIFALLQKEDFEAALTLINKTLESSDQMQLQMLKLQVLLVSEKVDAATAHAKKLFAQLSSSPEDANMLAWNLYEMSQQKPEGLDVGIIALAKDAAQKAADKSEGEEKASILDTIAHIEASLGNIDKAILIETEALKLSGERDREFIETYLKELKELKEKSATAGDDK